MSSCEWRREAATTTSITPLREEEGMATERSQGSSVDLDKGMLAVFHWFFDGVEEAWPDLLGLLGFVASHRRSFTEVHRHQQWRSYRSMSSCVLLVPRSEKEEDLVGVKLEGWDEPRSVVERLLISG